MVEIATRARRPAECTHERVAKSAMRFIPVSQSNIVETGALPKLIQCIPHPGSSTVGLKGHAVVILEISANTEWIDAGAPQVRIFNTCFGVMCQCHRASYPFGRTSAGIHRPAPFAWPVARKQSLPGAGEIVDIACQRLSRRARWAAKNSGRSYSK